jgi:HEAT repeat protein
MIAKQPDNKSDDTRQELTRRLEEKEQQRERIKEINSLASAPVIADLAEAGFYLEWVSDLYHQKLNYKSAIPVLLKWLPRIDNLDVEEAIVRALTVPWAKSIAAPALIAEFHKVQNESNIGIKWAIANALSVVADDRVFIEIVDLVSDHRHGKAREMLALSLGNMKDPRAQDVLIGLLDDEEVAGHAIMALGKLKSIKAYQTIERFLNSPKAWVRKEAKKALLEIAKAKGTF